MEFQFVHEAALEGQVGAFYDAFGLRNAGGFELNAKMLTGIVELSENIFALIFDGRRAIIKDRAVIGLEFSRDTEIAEDLVEDVIIAIERFLPVKEGANYRPSGVIDSQMKDSFAFSEPAMERAVHLDFFAEVFTALLAWMGVFDSDLMTDNCLDFTVGDRRILSQ